MTSLAIIGARLNSSRLPRKHLLDLAGRPLISRLLERVKKCKRLDEITLATTSDDFNQDLITWAKENKIKTLAYQGEVSDLMGRLNTLIEREKPEYITYICGDCPLVEPKFIDHALRQLEANTLADTIELKKTITSIHEGIHIYRYKGWQKLMSVSLDEKSREHVGYGNRITPVLNTLAIDDSADYSCITHRISVDTLADYHFMSTIYQRWYALHKEYEIVDLQWVQSELLNDASLIDANQHVIQKSPDQSYGKAGIFCHVSEKIGMGHLKRCSLIAQALQENLGLATTLYIQGSKKALPWLHTKAIWLVSFDELLDCMIQHDIWVIDLHPNFIDCDKLKIKCHKAQKEDQQAIIALDKLHCLLGDIDELFVPAFYSKIQHKDINYGWENYFLPKFNRQNIPKRLTILTGGSDALDYGASVPKIVENSLSNDWKLTWIQGPYAPTPALKTRSRWVVVQNPKNLSELMAQSEVILSCYGLSLFEAMASGALTVLLPTQHLCDERELHALEHENICLVCSSLEQLPDILCSLEHKKAKHQEIINNAQLRLTNVNGAKRLSESVNDLLEVQTNGK